VNADLARAVESLGRAFKRSAEALARFTDSCAPYEGSTGRRTANK
jgi:hypothetical protein